jgi:hypothetical protein
MQQQNVWWLQNREKGEENIYISGFFSTAKDASY